MGISSINGSNSKCVKIVKFFFIFFILGIDNFSQSPQNCSHFAMKFSLFKFSLFNYKFSLPHIILYIVTHNKSHNTLINVLKMFLSVITVINIIIYHIVGIRHIHTQVRVQSRPFFTNEVQNLSFYTQRHTIIINRRHFKTLNYRFIHLLYECSTTTKPLYIKNMFKHVTFTFVAFKILGNDALNDT